MTNAVSSPQHRSEVGSKNGHASARAGVPTAVIGAGAKGVGDGGSTFIGSGHLYPI